MNNDRSRPARLSGSFGARMPAKQAARFWFERIRQPRRQRSTAGHQAASGTVMATPPKIPANDRLSPKVRATVAAAGPFAALVVAALLLPLPWSAAAEPKPAEPEPTLTAENAAELCQKLFEDPKQYIGEEALRRRWDLRAASCRMALDADPANTE